MKISLFTTGFAKYPIERAFEVAARCGYDGIDIGGFRPHAYPLDLDQGSAEKILELSNKYQLPIVSYVPENTGSPYSLVFEDKKMNQESIDYFKKALDFSKVIKAEYFMLACNHPGYGRNREDVKKTFIDNLKTLTKYAEEIGQTIILEPVTPYEGTIIVSADDVVWAINEVNSPNLKCVVDLACPLTNREPLSEYFEKLGEKVVQIHFIDAIASSEDHLIPGDGELDFKRIVAYLRRIKYNGYLSLELFSRYENEPDFSAEKGIEAIQDLLGDV